jgi:hypothetical protein
MNTAHRQTAVNQSSNRMISAEVSQIDEYVGTLLAMICNFGIGERSDVHLWPDVAPLRPANFNQPAEGGV